MKTPELIEHVNFRVTHKEGAALRQLAKALGLSLSELVRLLLSRGLETIITPEGGTNANDG